MKFNFYFTKYFIVFIMHLNTSKIMLKKYSYFVLLILALILGKSSIFAISETWESRPVGSFNGLGDTFWEGDTDSFEISNSTWPTGLDFDGFRSLRSNSNAGGITSTIMTEISPAFDAAADFSWSIFASGNSAGITSSKRLDLILLSDSNVPSSLESPSNINGYKLSLWDPLASGGEGHAGAALGDSLSLWKATGSDTEWQFVDAHELGSSVDIDLGWNLGVTRSSGGEWNVSFANGAPGTLPSAPVITVVDNAVPLNGDKWYSGVGVLTTSTDAADFGVDNFVAVPEPSTSVLILGVFALGVLWLRVRRKVT